MVWAAAMGAAASLLGSWMQGSASKKAAKRQYEYQLDLMNRQNAYNHPVAQMERLEDAGLNPMLVYGNGSVVGNTSASGSAPPVGSADYQAAAKGVSSAVEGFFVRKKLNQDIQLGQEQIEQVKNNNLLLQMQAAKVGADALSALYNLQIAKKRGTRDGQLSSAEGLASAAEKVVDGYVSKRERQKLEDEKFNKKFFDWW